MENSIMKTRERASRFTAFECQRLAELVDQHKDVLLRMRNDANTCLAKEQAWAAIQEEYNTTDAVIPRTVQQLKYKYDNLKKSWRKTNESYISTDGVEEEPYSESEQIIHVKEEISRLENTYEADDQNDIIYEPNLNHKTKLKKRARNENGCPENPHSNSAYNKLRMKHAEELHQQALRQREEEHAIKMDQLEAKAQREQREHEMRMEVHRCQIESMKKQRDNALLGVNLNI